MKKELFCYLFKRAVVQEDEICPSCGTDLLEYENETPSEKKYAVLMRIRESAKIFTAVTGTSLVVALLYFIFLKDIDLIIYTIIPIINIGVLLIFFEFIKVLVDIKQSSRAQYAPKKFFSFWLIFHNNNSPFLINNFLLPSAG